MVCMRIKYVYFIILLNGFNYLSAHEDKTEEIVDAIEETTIAQILKEVKYSLKNDYNDSDEDDETKVQNPTIQRLPADSETIRRNIIDSKFSCDEREPGFYADTINDCQIFHRCLHGRKEIFSFICPEQTIFDQRILVCVSDDDYDIPCSTSEQYYYESNRAFYGNATAEESIEENLKNSLKIKSVALLNHSLNPLKNEVKLFEIIVPTESDILIESSESGMIKTHSLGVESTSEESNDYQAEFIPSSSNHIDASLATSSNSELDESIVVDDIQPPQKLISLSVLDPILELPSEESVTSQDIQKRSKSHQNRFLFRADKN